jgi:hypothetical protein
MWLGKARNAYIDRHKLSSPKITLAGHSSNKIYDIRITTPPRDIAISIDLENLPPHMPGEAVADLNVAGRPAAVSAAEITHQMRHENTWSTLTKWEGRTFYGAVLMNPAVTSDGIDVPLWDARRGFVCLRLADEPSMLRKTPQVRAPLAYTSSSYLRAVQTQYLTCHRSACVLAIADAPAGVQAVCAHSTLLRYASAHAPVCRSGSTQRTQHSRLARASPSSTQPRPANPSRTSRWSCYAAACAPASARTRRSRREACRRTASSRSDARRLPSTGASTLLHLWPGCEQCQRRLAESCRRTVTSGAGRLVWRPALVSAQCTRAAAGLRATRRVRAQVQYGAQQWRRQASQRLRARRGHRQLRLRPGALREPGQLGAAEGVAEHFACADAAGSLGAGVSMPWPRGARASARLAALLGLLLCAAERLCKVID